MPSFGAFTSALLLALAIAGSAVRASPAMELATPETMMRLAITDATDLSIDIDGPIPKDYTAYDPVENKYFFAEGSKASAWARAQIARSSLHETKSKPTTNSAKLEKRNSGVAIGMWQGSWCSGSGWYVPNVVYGVHYYSVTPFYSVGIGGRSLGPWEQLDFSAARTTCPTTTYFEVPWPTATTTRLSPRQTVTATAAIQQTCQTDYCGRYLYSAGTYTQPGCWNSMAYNCYHLWTK